jgi:hypothetical protein
MISPDHVKRGPITISAYYIQRKLPAVKLKQMKENGRGRARHGTKILAFLPNGAIDGRTGGIDHGSHL